MTSPHGSDEPRVSLSSDSSGLTLQPLPDHLRFSSSEVDQSADELVSPAATPEEATAPLPTQPALSGVTLPISNVVNRQDDVSNPLQKSARPVDASSSTPQIISALGSETAPDNDNIATPSSPQIYRMVMNRVTHNQIGFNYRFGCHDFPQNLQRAYDSYAQAADMGSCDALVYLAIAHIFGLAVEQSPKTAYGFLRRAILQGSADAVEIQALCSLAGTYGNGRDEGKFLYLIHLGIEMNAPGCLIWTGLSFEIGIGTLPNSLVAKSAYMAAGNAVSLNHVLQMSYPGILTAGDPWLLLKCALYLLHSVGQPGVLGHAMDCLKQAALLDCKEAQVYLAICLNEGKWLKKDTNLSLFWYREAAKGDCPHPIATRLVSELEE